MLFGKFQKPVFDQFVRSISFNTYHNSKPRPRRYPYLDSKRSHAAVQQMPMFGDETTDFFKYPKRFRRHKMTIDEMQCVNMGGIIEDTPSYRPNVATGGSARTEPSLHVMIPRGLLLKGGKGQSTYFNFSFQFKQKN